MSNKISLDFQNKHDKLVEAAKEACVEVASLATHESEVPDLVDDYARRLEATHCNHSLTNEERRELSHFIMSPRVISLMDVGQLDRRLLDGKHKQAYFLWGHIKSRCVVGDELVISQSNYVKWCGGDGRAQMKALNTLIEFKAITVVQEGKNGPDIWQPAVYRREL